MARSSAGVGSAVTRSNVAAAVEITRLRCFGVPEVDRHVIARSRLSERLSLGSTGALSVVEAPTGSGKTLGVARWVTDEAPMAGVVWLDASTVAHSEGRLWAQLRSGLLAIGCGPLPPEPPAEPPSDRAPDLTMARWRRWFEELADALDDDGRRWLLVLDDFPIGPTGRMGEQLIELLRRTTRLHTVLTCTAAYALALPGRRTVAGYTRIGSDVLRMDDEETAALLVAEDVPADGALVAELSERTRGWALGAAVAARMMARAPSPEAVMADLDDVLDELIDRAAWSWLPAVGREIVLRTSVADEVSSDLARAVLRLDGPLPTDWVEHSRGFVQIGPGGSLHPHPLLRRCALRRLDRDWPAMARDARRTAAAWFVDHGEWSVGVDLAARGGDRHWVAALLIDSLVVPSILLGTTELPGSDLRGELGAGEPLLAAAVDAAAGRVAEADEELARAGAQPVRPGLVGGGLPRRLSEALVRMAIARHRVQPEAGLRLVAEGRRLSTQLSRAHRQLAPELSALLDAYEGAFLMFAGELDRAVAVVEPATRAISASVAGQVATTECAGLLACLEALRGNLTSAARHAAAVLTSRPADGDEPGVGYAQLAAAWVHLERRELNEARQRLVHAARTADRVREPWLTAMRKLAEARVATAGAEPDLALRSLSAMGRSAPVSAPGWLGDRRAVDLAEAHLAAGQPRRALAALTPEPARTIVEARAMAAAARRAIGDRRGARALLSAAEPRLPDAPLPAVVQVLSLQAQLAAEGADNERAAALARRALRTAGREELRTALSIGSPWLSAYVERHPDLLRLHGDLVAPLDGSRPPRQVTEGAAAGGIAPEPLTNRELQVLCRLGQLATTSEIAADLFVSANTVKTHVKSLFLKLAVNRRADAVRRGRELGLC